MGRHVDTAEIADSKRAMVERGLVADAPAKIDGLEPRAVLPAQRSQLRKHVALERVALFFQVLERRTDEDAKSACGYPTVLGRLRPETRPFELLPFENC